jgi:hypothetical protein
MVTPPCRVVQLQSAFRVNDANERTVAYVHFAEDARLSTMPDLWTRDEAWAIAERIARGFTRTGAGQEKAPPE